MRRFRRVFNVPPHSYLHSTLMIALALIQHSARRAMYVLSALLLLAALLVSPRLHAEETANIPATTHGSSSVSTLKASF
jgi:hypothetical protein